MSATAAGHGLVFEDLLDFPDDGFKRELIGGRLVVTPDQPTLRHQRVVGRISATILAWTDERGGEVFPGANVDPAVGEHMEPDVVFLGPDFAGAANERSVLAAPDLVVEVSSPSTRRYDLGDKRLWYERQGVSEYWFVDLDSTSTGSGSTGSTRTAATPRRRSSSGAPRSPPAPSRAWCSTSMSCSDRRAGRRRRRHRNLHRAAAAPGSRAMRPAQAREGDLLMCYPTDL